MSVPAALMPLTLALAMPATHAAAAQDAADTDVVQTTVDATSRMTVPVRVGEAGPFPFLLDTGAENTVVSRDLAEKLSLPAAKGARLMGVAGVLTVPTVTLDQIGLGRRFYYGLTAPVLERRHIGADGIIGLDSLQNQRVLLDFRRNIIAVDDARSLGGDAGYEIVVVARRRSGQLIMTDAVIDGVHTAVVIDTGAEATIGNRALQKALGRRGARLAPTELSSVTGQVLAADLTIAGSLRVHGLALGNVLIAFADSPPFARLGLARRPAVLLGMHELRLFPRVAIDFASRRVLFDLPHQAGITIAPRDGEATRLP